MTETSAKGLSQAAAAFLEARGLSLELCERLGLTSGTDRAGHEWIAIPYMRGDERINRKFRRVDLKAFRQDVGTEQILWRVDCVTDPGLAETPLLITEGEFDAIAAMQAGHWRTVSLPLGAPSENSDADALTSGKYAPIRAIMPLIESEKRIIIAADNDGPGAKLLQHLTAILGPARCQFLSYPEGCKDLNDVLRLHGEARVRECIDGAKWVRVVGVYKFSEMPRLPPLTTWRPNVYASIDALIPICPGQLSVWTGIPGHGKSSLLNAIAWSLAEQDGLRVAHGSFEAQPQREYFQAATAYRMQRPFSECSEHECNAVGRWLDEHVTFLVSDGYVAPGKEEFFDADLDWFFEAARTAVARDGCRLVILDPWSQIEHARAGSEPETTYIQRSIRRGRMFARTFDVHVAIVAHPTKMRRLEDGEYAMPEGYEISGSAHWFNGVDLGVTSHRAPPLIPELDENGDTTGEWIADAKSTRVLVRVWKKKVHSVMGKPGDAYASFSSLTGRYTAPEHLEPRTYPRKFPEPVRGRDD